MSTHLDRHLKISTPSGRELGQASLSPSPIIFATRRASVRRSTASTTYRSVRKRVRPLPPVPRPFVPSAPTAAAEKKLPSPPSPARPLPSPPSASNKPSILVTHPASCSSNSSSTFNSCDPSSPSPDSPPSPSPPPSSVHKALPSNPNPNPHRRRPQLRIQTYKADLMPAPSLPRRNNSFTSPLTPSIPQAPSPLTTKRRRIAKLRRHLGEPIPLELVIPKSRTRNRPLDTIWDGDGVGHLHVRVHKVETVERDDSDDSEESSIIDEAVDRASLTKRFSRKWLKEQAGRRWVEQDYQKVLRALRAL